MQILLDRKIKMRYNVNLERAVEDRHCMCSMDRDGFCNLWIGSSRHENNDEPFFKKHPGINKKFSIDR